MPEQRGEGAAPFSQRLLPGERILWLGGPGQGIRFTSRDMFLVPFSFLWGGFAIFWEMSVISAGAPLVMRLFGIPFVLVGLFMIGGRFWADAYLRANTAYAVTDKRVLVSRAGRWPKFSAMSLDRLPDVSVSETAGGRGTVRFGAERSWWAGGTSAGWSIWLPSLDPTLQFLDIADAAAVFSLVQAQSLRSAPAAPGVSA